ncbi:unnamed protein product [Sphagnum balticum]
MLKAKPYGCRSKLYAFIVWQIVGDLQATHKITSSRRSGISHVVTRIHPSKAPKVDHDSAIGLVLDDVTAMVPGMSSRRTSGPLKLMKVFDFTDNS